MAISRNVVSSVSSPILLKPQPLASRAWLTTTRRRSNRSTKRILTSSISSNASTTSMSTISLEMNRVFNCLFTRDAGPTSALTTSRENVALLASNLQHMQFVYGSHMTKEHAGALRILVIIQATHARAFRSSSEKPHRCKS